jgi:hypothetical protein
MAAKLKKAKKKKQSTREQSVSRERRLLPKLPEWIVTELGSGKIGIECPRTVVASNLDPRGREKCGGKAIVNKRRWLMIQPDYATRACTYCFNTNRIPKSALPKGDVRRLDYE